MIVVARTRWKTIGNSGKQRWQLVFALIGGSIEVIAFSELVKMLVRPPHEFKEELGEMAKGNVGGHIELAVDITLVLLPLFCN